MRHSRTRTTSKDTFYRADMIQTSASPPRAKSISDSALASLIAGAIGDACGSTFEGRSPTPDPILSRPWSTSDDTALTFATCEAIIGRREADPAAIAATFVAWYRAGRIKRAGAATTKALRELAAGAHWALVGRKGEHSAGNGPAMRAGPLAFLLDPFRETDRQRLRDICRITHHNDEAYAGALAVVVAVRSLAFSSTELDVSWLHSIAGLLPDTQVRDRVSCLAALPPTTPVRGAGLYGMSGHVVDSVPLALFAVSRSRDQDFTSLLQELVSLGGDADTNASIFGQVIGAAVGFAGIPADLFSRLPNSSSLVEQAERFAQFVAARR
jgi:ADP-ribosyl-[dinitrogen reductase] hydrolase